MILILAQTAPPGQGQLPHYTIDNFVQADEVSGGLIGYWESSGMLVEGKEFSVKTGLPPNTEDNSIFRYCRFMGLMVDGSGFDGALIGCEFADIDWSQAFFNTVAFHRVKFKNCTFRGARFIGCDMVECQFETCRFLQDDNSNACKFYNCRMVECTFDRCEVVEDGHNGRAVFANTRLHGCAHRQCIGLEELF
jgi:hypothetical protein